MTIVTQVTETMQEILTTVATAAGRTSGFVQRASKLDGAAFTQTLVFGWMANPEASLEELAQTAAQCGVAISPQGLDQRFTPAAADCLRQVLAAAVGRVLRRAPAAEPLLDRFPAVYIQDSTTITLPDALKTLGQSCGGDAPSGAALKLQVRWELRGGQLEGPFLQPGYENDPGSCVQRLPLPPGALRLADLGYWSVERFGQISATGGYWLSRWKADTQVFTADGQVLDLVAWLFAQKGDHVEPAIELSAQHRLPCRLLAQRVPPDVRARRRRKLRQAAQKKGRTLSRRRLALADWTILVTNVPAEQLTLPEALVLMGVRWQIELLFKLWKSHGRIDQSRRAKPYRILCEVYAKLWVMVMQHWILLCSEGPGLTRSLVKAVQSLRKQAWALAAALPRVESLRELVKRMGRILATGCRINKRRQQPATFQRLQQCAAEGLA